MPIVIPSGSLSNWKTNLTTTPLQAWWFGDSTTQGDAGDFDLNSGGSGNAVEQLRVQTNSSIPSLGGGFRAPWHTGEWTRTNMAAVTDASNPTENIGLWGGSASGPSVQGGAYRGTGSSASLLWTRPSAFTVTHVDILWVDSTALGQWSYQIIDGAGTSAWINGTKFAGSAPSSPSKSAVEKMRITVTGTLTSIEMRCANAAGGSVSAAFVGINIYSANPTTAPGLLINNAGCAGAKTANLLQTNTTGSISTVGRPFQTIWTLGADLIILGQFTNDSAASATLQTNLTAIIKAFRTRTASNCTVTSGTNVSWPAGNLDARVDLGKPVTIAGATGAYIESITSATTCVLSSSATNGTNVTMTITAPCTPDILVVGQMMQEELSGRTDAGMIASRAVALAVATASTAAPSTSGLASIDLGTALYSTGIINTAKGLLHDGVHANANGHTLIASWIARVLLHTNYYPLIFPSWDSPRDLSNPPVSTEINILAGELGLNPRGSDASVAARLTRIDRADPSTGAGLRSMGGTGTATSGARSDHTHTTYQLLSEKNTTYVGLNSSGKVPVAYLGANTPTSSTFLRGDGWIVPSGGGGAPSGAAGGDLSGSYPSPSVSGIFGYALDITAPLDGQVYEYSSANNNLKPQTVGAHQYIVAANDSNFEWIKHANYVCDGVNDQTEINAAIVAATNSGARYGDVFLAPGTYNIVLSTHPNDAGSAVGIILYSKTSLRSIGRHGAKIKITNGQATFGSSYSAALMNYNPNSTGTRDIDIAIEGIVVDCNGAVNTSGNAGGIDFQYVDNPNVMDCISKNARSNATGVGSNSRSQIRFRYCRNAWAQRCIATTDDSGRGGIGIAYTYCTGGGGISNIAYGNGYDGFNCHSSVDLLFINLYGYSNGQTVFSATGGFGVICEYSRNITFTNCIFGSRANHVNNPWGTTNVSLGNGSGGMYSLCNEDLNITNVIGNYNGALYASADGFNFNDTVSAAEGAGITNHVTINNIIARTNANHGFGQAGTITMASGVKVRNMRAASNSGGQQYIPSPFSPPQGGTIGAYAMSNDTGGTTTTTSAGSVTDQPSMISSGTSYAHFFLCQSIVYIAVPASCTLTASIDNIANVVGTVKTLSTKAIDDTDVVVSLSSTTVLPIVVEPGQSIFLTYSGGTPTWYWWYQA